MRSLAMEEDALGVKCGAVTERFMEVSLSLLLHFHSCNLEHFSSGKQSIDSSTKVFYSRGP